MLKSFQGDPVNRTLQPTDNVNQRVREGLSARTLPYVVAMSLCVAATSALSQFAYAGPGGRELDDETIKQLISEWDVGNYSRRRKAREELVKLGGEAVPALGKLIQENHRHSGYAMQTLADMGAAARPALPILLKLAQDKSAKDPEDWKWNMPIRAILLSNIRKMSWGAKEFVPTLERIAKDEDETDQLRGIAVNALGGMGPNALPALRRFGKTGSSNVRESAVNAIVAIETKAGKKKTETLQEVIDADPFDTNVPTYLANMKGTYNLGKIHPPTQEIKKLYREELAKKPNAPLAWALANIIRNQLANTDLMWASPSDSYRSRVHREDPNENYETLATALDMVVASSEPDSELRKKASISLARLRLLQGDWEGMNAQLKKLGQDPIPSELRPTLPAPPIDWQELKKNWQPADKAMRSGNCGLEFRFLRRGQRLQGIQGIHVLVKQRPAAVAGGRAFSTGIRADTLFLATQPMGSSPFGAFGYRGADRNVTRYAVSNKQGVVRIENLPNKPMLVEILVPTANFAEPGHKWDLLMATRDGVKIADRGNPKSVDASKPPALVELVEGATVRYPLIYVRSQLIANVSDWSSVEKDKFQLAWKGPKELEVDHYNVTLNLSAPTEDSWDASRSPVVSKQTVKTTEPTWPLGERGVGDLKLVPGNIYSVEVAAVKKEGTIIASSPRYRFWIPWEHRTATPPSMRRGSRPAFYDNIWLRTNVNGKSLEERLPALIKDSPAMFETEYHRLGMAWLDLHKNKAGAKDKLRGLVKELPAGNIVRSTAQSLLDLSENGQAIPKRFKFVGP